MSHKENRSDRTGKDTLEPAVIPPLFRRGAIDSTEHEGRDWPSFQRGAGFVNDSILAKLVVTVIVLISFTIWMAANRRQSHDCKINCATDFSASRK
jgi:hypothetical protein